MKKLLVLILVFCYGFSQTNCELCVEQNGFYCGDDESNWTQYSPNGCVPNGLNGLFYLNDGWLDCVDGSDENEATATTIEECNVYNVGCDTIYVDVFVTDTIFITTIDTITNIEYIDCESGLPCGIGLQEILENSKTKNALYNLQGKEIRQRKGVYIEKGIIKLKIN